MAINCYQPIWLQQIAHRLPSHLHMSGQQAPSTKHVQKGEPLWLYVRYCSFVHQQKLIVLLCFRRSHTSCPCEPVSSVIGVLCQVSECATHHRPCAAGTCMCSPACHAHCRGHTIKLKIPTTYIKTIILIYSPNQRNSFTRNHNNAGFEVQTSYLSLEIIYIFSYNGKTNIL